MHPVHIVDMETPKKVRLNGFLYGPAAPRRAVILVHGFSSSAFSKQRIAQKLADADTAVLVFGNRGHDVVANIPAGYRRFTGGAAFERFEDCVDDIDGALAFVAKLGAREVFLGGSSTGCQKSVYWWGNTASRKKRLVKGLLLMVPVNDREAYEHETGVVEVTAALRAARKLVAAGRPDELLPHGVFPLMLSAQRAVSLLEYGTAEDIFTYARPATTPEAFRSVTVPMIVIWATEDEYNGYPIESIRSWFLREAKAPITFATVRSGHLLKGAEAQVVRLLTKFMKDPYSSSVTVRTARSSRAGRDD